MIDRPSLEPALKWAGSKRWLAHRLIPYYQRDRRLVDPFAGAMTVPLYLKPDKCLTSDVNPHLMNFHRWLQNGLEWDENCGVPFSNDSIIYYDNRTKFNALCASREYWTKEGALLFYYLNRTGFNGLCRFNKSGFFNVPFGRYKSIDYKKDFNEYKAAMAGWELYCGDFESLPLDPTDFIYADPPYDVEFTQFAPRDFTWNDQERLANWLANHSGPVIASNSLTARVVSLYRTLGFDVYSGEAPRSISCTGDRTPAMEILALKGF
jgi:DNA adenine methylase